MNKKYISKAAESKIKYHRSRAKMPYEEKFRIIIELQKIEAEMMKSNKSRTNSRIPRVWEPE
ncbi:MAG: hypothetical protein RBR74_05550 [Ignavibacteriaceae bacterium]|jgi:hypothetical protein|nr:hypothetical protein [Ignavibacteriaceae bacterium]